MRKRLLLPVTTATIIALLTGMLVSTAPAEGSYPGTTDGRLAFGMPMGNVATTDIYAVTPTGEALHQLTANPDFEACTAYSPDGTDIAYCRGGFAADAVAEIWKMKHNGNKQQQVTRLGARSLFPDFSPDGARITFMSAVSTTAQPDIYVIGSDGTGLVQLTSDPAADLFPAWSPDGHRIAFVSTRNGGVPQVWVMNADGSDPTQLTFDPAPKGQLPDWSPDGTRIAYQSAATGGGDIYVMHADGTANTRLTTDPALDFGPAWSPTGTRIAFLSTRNGPDRQLFVMNADGTGQTLIHKGDHLVPAWQPRFDQPDTGS